MRKNIRTEGICLRRLNYSDTSQVATFLSPELGRVPCMAKGIWRSPKKGISSGIDLLACYRLTLYESKTGTLKKLTEHSMLDPFRGLRGAIEPTLCGFYTAELMRNFTAEGQDCRRIYRFCKRVLGSFAAGRKLGISVLALELETLRHQGACPTFDECCLCGTMIKDRGMVRFSAAHGGPVCSECQDQVDYLSSKSRIPVHARRLHMLNRIVRGQGWKELEENPMEIVALSRLLRFHMRYLIGKELKMWKYLQGRYMSKYLRRVQQSQ